jgi:hypothetical protein
MGYRKKTSTDKIPPEVAAALRHGKKAYTLHHSWEEDPDNECQKCFLTCGLLIHDPTAGPKMWRQYRSELMKRSDIRSWWGYTQYEKQKDGSKQV